MLPISLVLVLSLALALVCSAIPWLVRRLSAWTLAIGLVAGIAVGLMSLVLALSLYPWSDVVVLVVAWSGGLLLGRWVAPQFSPFLLVFLCFSVADVLQFAAGLSASSASGPPTLVNSSPLHLGDFLLLLPWGRFAINLLDVLLITALAEHWRRRGASYLIALLPSALGFLLADGFVLLTGRGLLPGIPFFTAGYLVSEVVYRYVSRHRGGSAVAHEMTSRGSDGRVDDMARKLQDRLLEYGSDHLRLLMRVMRELARGRPLTVAQVNGFIGELGIAPDAAHHFLRQLTERDAHGQIVGALGLSLQDHPHRMSVDGVSLRAWCAEDTLFLPAILQETATIESPSPVSGQPIRLRVSPERVEKVSPASAVVSLVLVDPSREHMASTEAIWSVFCRHIHFFATRDEAERWATGTGRDDIAILSVEEGFAWQRPVWSEVMRAAAA